MRRLIVALTLGVAAPADAATRDWSIGSIERLRIEAPITVRVVTDGGTGVRATGPDAAAIAALTVTANGDTLTVRARGGATLPGTVTIVAPRLASVAVYATAAVSVEAIAGARVSLSLAGDGTLTVARLDAGALAVTLVGGGRITAAGRGGEVRMIANGPGTIDATALRADQLTVLANGDSIVHAAARYTATVTAGRDSQVTVAGHPRCTLRAARPAGVRCGER